MANENNEVLLAALNEALRDNRKARRLTLWFRLAMVGLLIISLVSLQNKNKAAVDRDIEHVAVISIHGEISASNNGALEVTKMVRDAFSNAAAKAVVLDLDSPGGSATQSDIIYSEIMSMKDKYDKPVIGVIGDMCASGCYFIASSTDEIRINTTSMVGSIGVRVGGFDFSEVLSRFGVSRNEITAGQYKLMMDPFVKTDPEALEHIKKHVVEPTYNRFKEVVMNGRGEKLKNDPLMFSGLVWSGNEALSMGLADKIGDLYHTAEELYGDGFSDEHLVVYNTEQSGFDSLMSRFTESAIQSVVKGVKSELAPFFLSH